MFTATKGCAYNDALDIKNILEQWPVWQDYVNFLYHLLTESPWNKCSCVDSLSLFFLLILWPLVAACMVLSLAEPTWFSVLI